MNTKGTTEEYVDYYLGKLRQGEFETAFHSLVGANHSVIPKLIEAFRIEADAKIRAELVDITWNHRLPETVAFLGEALRDESPVVWKSALDGLVTLATPGALEVLKASLDRQFSDKKLSDEFKQWVSEAIEQIERKSV